MKNIVDETVNRIYNEEYSLITEMAYNKQHIFAQLDRQKDKIIEHLLLCLLYNKQYKDTIYHWESEINAFLNQSWKLKSTNNYPTYKQLLDWGLYTWLDTLKDHLPGMINNLEDKYGKINETINYKLLANCIMEYFKWLYKGISTGSTVIVQDTRNKIDCLISIYNKGGKLNGR